jgi:hypothetical protein
MGLLASAVYSLVSPGRSDGVNVMKREPIASRYSLERLESLILEDIYRLQKQIDEMESSGWTEDREALAATYREMLETRRRLLDQVRSQSKAFVGRVVSEAS